MRKNAHWVILRTRLDETLAMARIVRLRIRRKLAEADLAHRRRRARMQRTAREWQARIEHIIDDLGKSGRR